VGTADEAIAAAEEIGFPVAVKTVSAELSHKTEFGGVRLNVRTPNEMKVTIAELESAFRSAASSTAALSGFLVQEMISGVEVIVGARMDEQYGPVLLIGSGGTTVELQRDIALHMLPVTADDIQASLGRLRLGALLRGYRGQPSADILAFVECAIGLGRFFLDHRQSLADIEINPLFVRANGRGTCAADIRTLWR
jgi:acetyltransferase